MLQCIIHDQMNDLKNQYLSDVSCIYIPEINSYIRKENWDSNKFSIDIARILWIENKIDDNIYKEIINNTAAHKCTYVRLNKEHTFWLLLAIRVYYLNPLKQPYTLLYHSMFPKNQRYKETWVLL